MLSIRASWLAEYKGQGSGMEKTKIDYWLIARAYIKILAKPSGDYRSESELPFPKPTIRRAIASLLLEELDEETRNQLQNAYVFLETFLGAEEYRLVSGFFSIIENEDTRKLVSETAADPHRKKGELAYEKKDDWIKLAKQISNAPYPDDLIQSILRRINERRYQVRVLRSIALDECDPDIHDKESRRGTRTDKRTGKKHNQRQD